MLDLYKDLITRQYDATLCMLQTCIDRCPAAQWHAPVFKYQFCQTVFHTLVFTDLYLGPSEAHLREQPFHREHASVFRDYEEFEDRVPVQVYEQAWTRLYLQFCRTKAREVVQAETAESLAATTDFPWLKFPRAELHVYNLRHIHHHAAQLSLRLKLDCQQDVPWVGSGWREPHEFKKT